MAFVPAPNVCQAELFFVWDGQEVENVYHFFPTDPLTPTLMEELGEHLVDWWETAFPSTSPTTLSLVNIKLTDQTTNFAPVVNYAVGLPSAGTSAGVSLPNNVSMVITKRTLLRGRSYRGRIYHLGLLETQVTNNAVTPALVTSFVSNYGLLMSFTTLSTSWNMVVCSRYNEGVPRVEADSNAVTSLDSNGRVTSQRRRLPS